MVESIQQFVKNKRIVFVGNSVEIMKHKLADVINNAADFAKVSVDTKDSA